MALDVLTPTADIMSQYAKKRFLQYLEAYKSLLALLREGFSDKLLDMISNQSMNSLAPSATVNIVSQDVCSTVPTTYCGH